MPTTFDLSKPALTDAYTAIITELQTAIQGLGAFIDPTYFTPSNPPTGTKRYNSSTGLFEQNTGTPSIPAWSVLAVSYLQTTSSGTQTVSGTVNFTGTLQIAGAAAATQAYVTSALASYATTTYVSANYAPLGGAGVSGTWGISITGNAATATTAAACSGNAATCTTASNSNSLGGVAAASWLQSATAASTYAPIAKGVKAWVLYNGSTLSITAQQNVSSITRIATGQHNINLTSGAAAAQMVIAGNAAASYGNFAYCGGEASSTTQAQVGFWNGTAWVEASYHQVAIFSN